MTREFKVLRDGQKAIE
jgi:hypothetical protein